MRFALLVPALVLGAISSPESNGDFATDRVEVAVIEDVPSTCAALRIVKAAYQQLGISVDTLQVPSRRALFLAEQGRVDADLFRTPMVGEEKENLIRVPYPLLQGRLMAVFPEADVGDEPAFSGKRVAVRRGVLIAERTAERLGMDLARTRNYEQSLNLLEHRRVDMALVSHIEGGSPLGESKWARFHIHPEPVARFTLYHYVHRRHADLVEPLAEIMENQSVRRECLNRDSVGDQSSP
ncbi:hypothetical protein CK501_08905 [Halovibrio salipaludis]|uniref:Uncharacterized protein n=1 Tax=Halovibrio salipaludis TaxID=2032626 RepID=A0A2A2F7N1_9GAMM|nr:transporter substrate-binding domain-containing protein [Halovibrio salipaludis]PAU80543.1 hypothetical protein CK501_08905 [Halovibrio salipaludis]